MLTVASINGPPEGGGAFDTDCKEAILTKARHGSPMSILAGLLAIAALPALAPAGELPGDTLIRELVARVSQDSVMASIRRLQAFQTRVSQSESCRAAVNWALDRMRAYGCDSAYADEFETLYAPNAVGVKVGRSNPRRIYIICGHIDDWCYPPDVAPGADDNASGTTAALEACRVLTGHDFDYTVRFICFNAEENGMRGSIYYAWHASLRGDSILGVFNFDMISHGDSGYDSVRVLGRATDPNCSLLVNTYCAMADSYTQLQYHSIISDTVTEGSDHRSFWQFGYPAILVREAQRPPSWHSLLDSVGPYRYRNCGTNNVPLATEVIKTAVATLARLAGARPLALAEPGPVCRVKPRLATCSPNPFAVMTRINYSAPGGQCLRIAIYDLTGKRVWESKTRQSPVVWAAENEQGHRVQSGVYFARLGDGVSEAQLRLVKVGD